MTTEDWGPTPTTVESEQVSHPQESWKIVELGQEEEEMLAQIPMIRRESHQQFLPRPIQDLRRHPDCPLVLASKVSSLCATCAPCAPCAPCVPYVPCASCGASIRWSPLRIPWKAPFDPPWTPFAASWASWASQTKNSLLWVPCGANVCLSWHRGSSQVPIELDL